MPRSKEESPFPANVVAATELEFLQTIKDGGMTLHEALTFEQKPYRWFGPGIDVKDILDKYITLGVVRVDLDLGKYLINDEVSLTSLDSRLSRQEVHTP